ncbi:hypothetical protein, partial [Marisediminicola senii]|uniref:hypothetical protein n=1 Tax=Marisediminicola senii TaxID=2711233 RepID=UPI001F290AD7
MLRSQASREWRAPDCNVDVATVFRRGGLSRAMRGSGRRRDGRRNRPARPARLARTARTGLAARP